MPLSSAADLDDAVRAAQEAFPAWRRTPTIERARRMFTLRQALVENQERIARLVTQDMGKTLPDAFAEVGRAIEMVECAAAVPTTMQGRNLENVATNVDCETYRQPIGVFGAICPFNFPAMVPMWFLPFSVACGNTFVLKPSEQVPLAQEAIFQLIHDLELLPPGVINLVHGSREVVEGICDHPGIAGVSFVGSATVAKLVYERSARAGKRVQALGGAKNHMVVMPDAVVDKTVDNIIGSSFGAAGQRCMAGSVLVTVGSAHERIVPALIAAAEKLRVGNGLEKGIGVGPLVSSERRDIVRSWIDKGAAEGANVVLDGREENGDNAAGAFVGPTIIDDVTPDMEVAREEIFGPVLSVVKVDTLERGDRPRQQLALRQRLLDLHRVRRRRPPLPPRLRRGHDRRQHRRRGARRVLPVLGLEGLVPGRPARPRRRCDRLLHAQDDRHDALVLRRRDRQVLRRVSVARRFDRMVRAPGTCRVRLGA